MKYLLVVFIILSSLVYNITISASSSEEIDMAYRGNVESKSSFWQSKNDVTYQNYIDIFRVVSWNTMEYHLDYSSVSKRVRLMTTPSVQTIPDAETEASIRSTSLLN